MANIYHAINQLNILKNSNKLTLSEKQFIALLENGDALLEFARSPMSQESGDYNIDNLIARVTAGISQAATTHRVYKRALRSLLTELNNIKQKKC